MLQIESLRKNESTVACLMKEEYLKLNYKPTRTFIALKTPSRISSICHRQRHCTCRVHNDDAQVSQPTTKRFLFYLPRVKNKLNEHEKLVSDHLSDTNQCFAPEIKKKNNLEMV